jgi:hypothetical protein
MQSTSFERLSQRVKPGFGGAVALVLENEQRLIEERLLSFRLTYAMLIDALARVPSVPIEADDARPTRVKTARPVADCLGGGQGSASQSAVGASP